ncbi:phosphoribosylglycinamide formyltransferase [Ferruginibacter sp. SUN106]|uniref:phosphoribosylglycinamide formyltransferase n=1 Tax=Ferruginibacter sp. SUN106 TaxID=2978348 RepID=UPI003D35C21D
MFEKLKQRWKVNGLNLVLIITTFAIGGSLCGYAGRKILALTNLEKGALWVILYILLITLLWPLCVLLVSFPFGQFGFFKKYLGRVFKRFGSSHDRGQTVATLNNTGHDGSNRLTRTRIAIFASGAGSNAQQIINHFSSSADITIALIVCNKPGAGILDIAANAGIPSLLIEKERFFTGDNYLPELQDHRINFIVLAGFLWKIPEALIKAYPKKIVNIHPALLPKYGGKGMFGRHVHEAVINNKETESGITIHYVDELYDHGAVIFQATCAINDSDTADTLAQKIHVLEHTHYPKVIAEIVEK